MSNVFVLCDHVSAPKGIADKDIVLPINHDNPEKNINVGIRNITHTILSSPNALALDLLDIAAYVYYADSSIKRGTNKDLFNEKWIRDFLFKIPVRHPKIWNEPTVKELLCEILEYMTEDRFRFDFSQRMAKPEQLVIEEIAELMPYSPEANCIVLFSGGMDSLCGTVHLYENGMKPVLVSHKSRPSLASLQRDLASEIRGVCVDWSFPHLHAWVNRCNSRAKEDSQRSRSFLFLSLGALAAIELKISELFIFENGITTFNLPRSHQTLGSFASRSTHPRVLSSFEQLTRRVFDTEIIIQNPFLWKTRAEIILELKSSGREDLLPSSVSCNHSRQPKIHPNCGVCSQCIDRRYAVQFAEADTTEELQTYGTDVFTDPIADEKKMQASSSYQFALQMRKLSVDTFVTEYVQILDVLEYLEGDLDTSIADIFNLYRRYADEVFEVIRDMHHQLFERIANAELDPDSLLMITRTTDLNRPAWKIQEISRDFLATLAELPSGDGEAFEELLEDIFIFLFCKDIPSNQSLKQPNIQSPTDQGYERRDLVFRNEATEGIWAEIRADYDAVGIVVDAKNHKEELDGDLIRGFASKYLKTKGLGRFGLLVGRKIPEDVRETVSQQVRPSNTVKVQKELWSSDSKMIILLDDVDLKEMIKFKMRGMLPTQIIGDRIFTLKSRM